MMTLIEKLRRQLSGSSLRARVVQSGLAVLAAETYTNVLRLGSNLIMTRLLYPEAFGLMLIVNLVIMVLNQLSDVGVKAALIARKDEIAPRYLDTAWTLLFARNSFLALATVAVAYPLASFYGKPELAGLLLLTAVIPMIHSFDSPNGMLYEKRIEMTRVILWNLTGTTASTAIVLVWLLIEPSIWALAANGVFAAIIGAVTSYWFFPGRRPRLCWDREIVRELFNFGRWVFLATALGYLARQGDSIVVSKAVTTEQLGTFSIAVSLSRLLEQVVGRLNWSVMFPAFAELNRREAADGALAEKQRKVKITLFALATPIVLAFAVGGQFLIDVLYDPRYQDAGWILQMLGAGALFVALGAPLRALTLALGDSFRYMWQQILSVCLLVASMVAGNALGGFPGLIAGIAVAQALEYLVVRWAVRPYSTGGHAIDYWFATVMSLVVFVAWFLMGWPWEAAR